MRENKAADLPVFLGNLFGEGRSAVVRSESVGEVGRWQKAEDRKQMADNRRETQDKETQDVKRGGKGQREDGGGRYRT